MLTTEAALVWAERAQAELGAAERFHTLANQLKQADSHPNIYQRAKAAEQEEEHHAFMCAKMAKSLGHPTGFATELLQASQSSNSYSWTTHTTIRDQALLDTVVLCCLTESFNACLLSSLYAQVDESESKSLIRRILKDEVQHAQIGWGHLQFESQQRDCRFIEEYFDEMFNISISSQLFKSKPAQRDDALLAFGVLPKHLRLQHFKDSLEQVIYPGFKRAGIDYSRIQNWVRIHNI